MSETGFIAHDEDWDRHAEGPTEEAAVAEFIAEYGPDGLPATLYVGQRVDMTWDKLLPDMSYALESLLETATEEAPEFVWDAAMDAKAKLTLEDWAELKALIVGWMEDHDFPDPAYFTTDGDKLVPVPSPAGEP